MSDTARPIHAAIARWREKGLVDRELADRLRAEVAGAEESEAVRASQYVLAVTGAITVLLAAGVFLSWAWPRFDVPTRAGLLAAGGVVARLAGARLESGSVWKPAAYLLQITGLALFLVALLYSETVWADRSATAVLLSSAGLLFALFFTARSLTSGAVMPAAHMAFGLAYLAVFLDRALHLDSTQVILVLDLVIVGLMAVLASIVRRDPAGREAPWAIQAMLVAMYAGLLMVWFNAVEIFDMDDGATLPLNVWFWAMVALTLWAVERSPEAFRRDWFPEHLASLVLLWIPLGFWTVFDVFDGATAAGPLLLSVPGAVAFLYADRRGFHTLMRASALCFVVGLWFWAVEAGGALGAVFALLATGATLFFYSGRRGGATSADTGSDGGLE